MNESNMTTQTAGFNSSSVSNFTEASGLITQPLMLNSNNMGTTNVKFRTMWKTQMLNLEQHGKTLMLNLEQCGNH